VAIYVFKMYRLTNDQLNTTNYDYKLHELQILDIQVYVNKFINHQILIK